jgi:hypothetical protein
VVLPFAVDLEEALGKSFVAEISMRWRRSSSKANLAITTTASDM